MTRTRTCRAAAIALVTTALVAVAPGTATGSRGEPPLSVDRDRLAAALSCPTGISRTRTPVLLVHGTGADSGTWSPTYGALLPRRGFDVCTVDLPAYGMADIQVASEYVVFAIRKLARAARGKVAVVGHSQGVLEPRWALRWWPSVRKQVSDVVSLAGANHGTTIADQACTVSVCAPALWQMRRQPLSKFLRAVNAGDETPTGPSWTSVYSRYSTDTFGRPVDNDGAIVPAASSKLRGAANIAVQDLCSKRPVGHARLIYDQVAFATVLDALKHAGPARAARVHARCDWQFPAGTDPQAVERAEAENTAVFAAAIVLGPQSPVEPPPASYTR